jgi:transaldolase
VTTLHQLRSLGQSPWLDFISRSSIRGGQIASLVELGIVGVTSNPAIFEAAIVGSSDYDEEIKALSAEGKDAFGIYDALSQGDVVEASKILRPVWDESEGLDGYVSLEVSPLLAHDTEGTIAEGIRLWESMGQPNIMIKVPATLAGIPAITALIAEGIPVNVTLIFSLERYEASAKAYIAGLEKRAAKGQGVNIASVASFFVSRVDTLLDSQLPEGMQSQAAIALAQSAYGLWEELFAESAFGSLAEKGALPQRLLWASTSVKNPSLSPTVYVEELIGAQTVNTMPLTTVQSVLELSGVQPALPEAVEDAKETLKVLEAAGVDFKKAGDTLEADGVEKFIKPFEKLLASVEAKRVLVTA